MSVPWLQKFGVYMRDAGGLSENMNQYQFTNTWFDGSRSIWESLLKTLRPRKILEIGSYEGASTCFMIDFLADAGQLELHCVDTWMGGVEHLNFDMAAVEARFHRNTLMSISRASGDVSLTVHRGSSDDQLAKMLAEGKREYFDFIYVDGSHQSPDVLCDAVLSFRLLKSGGILVFDDYLWFDRNSKIFDPIMSPKMAIDAFTNIYGRSLQILQAPLYQLYVKKIDQ